MQELHYYISFVCYIVLLVIITGFTVFFFWKTKKSSELKGQRDGYLLLIAFFFLCMTIAFYIRFYYRYIYPEDIDMFFESFFNSDFRYTHPFYASMVVIQGLIMIVGIGFITLAAEHYIYTKTKHILAIILFAYVIILSPFLIILPYDHTTVTYFMNIPIILSAIVLFVIMAIYLNLARRSAGSIRKKSILIAVGFFLFFAGLFLSAQVVMDAMGGAGPDRVWTVALFYNAGLIALFYGFKD